MARLESAAVGALCLATLLAACAPRGASGGEERPAGEDPREDLARAAAALKPLHEKKRRARPGDWLDRFEEAGQTFRQYLASDPVRPEEGRRHLAILLLGDFTAEQKTVVEASAEYMGLYFGLPVRFADPLGLDVIPDHARRVHPSWGVHQVNASFVLDRVLKPRVPEDAVALIAFTSSDLWPRAGWNFVFGMASIRERVGVWSIFRNGDPAGGEEARRLCLLRTLKTGTHETGHMLGMLHCILFECNMNGSNSREESDRGPLWLCPECVRKIWWACRTDPLQRYRAMEAFCARHGLEKEEAFFRASREKIEPALRKQEEKE